MILFRILLMAFNVAVVTYLVYHMFSAARRPLERSRKILIIAGGILLLLVPFAMLIRIVPPTPLYFLIYPVTISLFIYLTRSNF